MRSRCHSSRPARLRRRLPFVALAVVSTAILYVVLPNPAVVVTGAVVVLLVAVWAVRRRRFVGGPGGRPPGGGTAGVREPRRPRPTPRTGSMVMPLPDEDASEVAWA